MRIIVRSYRGPLFAPSGVSRRLWSVIGADMPEAENTLDALVESEVEQHVIEKAKRSIAGVDSHPVN